MTSYVDADLRRLVSARANQQCEYCLIHEDDTFFGCQIDHIIAEKHGGTTSADNLCYACTFCNRHKGTDIGSIANRTGEFTRFFNPRTDRWVDHFRINGFAIEHLTAVGEVTCIILGFNHPNRVLEREALSKVGRYPFHRAHEAGD